MMSGGTIRCRCLEDLVHMEDCTCDHPPEAHGWSGCKVPDCPCEGGWTE